MNLVSRAILVMFAATIGSTAVCFSAEVWRPAGQSVFSRSNHTATLLSSGEVLVAGGLTSEGVQSSVEIYNPDDDSWRLTGSMLVARTDHTATKLPSGHVVVIGGWGLGGTEVSAAELYDPATGSWTPAGQMAGPRVYHTASLMPNGKVLVVGGYDPSRTFAAGTLRSVELYDPASNSWSIAADLAGGRSRHTATTLPSGRVLVAGGKITNPEFAISSVEFYDPETNQWSPAHGMTNARSGHVSALLPSGQVLVVGGGSGLGGWTPLNSSEIYDPASNSWSPVDSLAVARAAGTFSGSLLNSGEVLVVGGGSGLAGVESYDFHSNLWRARGSLGFGRDQHSATVLMAGDVLLVGGNGAGSKVRSAERSVNTIFDETVSGDLPESWDALNAADRDKFTFALNAPLISDSSVSSTVVGMSNGAPKSFAVATPPGYVLERVVVELGNEELENAHVLEFTPASGCEASTRSHPLSGLGNHRIAYDIGEEVRAGIYAIKSSTQLRSQSESRFMISFIVKAPLSTFSDGFEPCRSSLAEPRGSRLN